MSPNVDVLVIMFAVGAVGGSGLLLAGLAIGYWIGKSMRRPDVGAVSEARDADANERLVALQRYAEELHRLLAEHRETMQGWETGRTHPAKEDRPLNAMRESTLLRATGDVELRKRHHELSDKIAFAEAQLHEQTAALTEILREARTDALTEVANRRSLDEALLVESELWRRSGRPFAVVMIDIDRFKSLNDKYGHQVGDRALQHVASVLRSVVPEDSLLARYGGEEFALLLSNADAENLRNVSRQIRVAIESSPLAMPEGDDLRITASLGAAIAMESEIGEQTVARADAALYASKKAGRNCAHWHDGERPRLLDVGMDDSESSTGSNGDAEKRASLSLDQLGRKALELFRMA